MSEFVLIKNADGSGQMLLRVAEIVRVEDGSEGNVVVVRGPDSESDVWLDTASTAAEVLEAIREARESRESRALTFYPETGTGYTHFVNTGHVGSTSIGPVMTRAEYEQRKGFDGSSK